MGIVEADDAQLFRTAGKSMAEVTRIYYIAALDVGLPKKLASELALEMTRNSLRSSNLDSAITGLSTAVAELIASLREGEDDG